MIKFLIKYRVKILAFAVLALFMFFLWAFVIWRADISQALADLGKYLRENIETINNFPMFFYAIAVCFLPIFFLPVSPIYFLASARAVTDGVFDAKAFAIVLSYCYIGVLANMILSYFISKKFGQILRERLSKRGINVPKIPRYEQYEFTFLMRMIPGNPLVVQNYVLGLADIPFDRYLLVSVPLQFLQIAAYVYFGESVFEGECSKIILGLSVLSVMAIVAAMLKKAYGRKLRVLKNG